MSKNGLNRLRDAIKQKIVKEVAEAPQKRHRRTKAEMEEFRRQQALALQQSSATIDSAAIQPKKRHRRTKAEMEEARRNANKASTTKIIDNAVVDPPRPKQSVIVKGKQLKPGELLFEFGGYSVTKFDDKNLLLSYRGLFQGYYGLDYGSVYGMMNKIGMGLIFKEPKKNDQGLIDINNIMSTFNKFEKFLRTEFLCHDLL